MPLRVTDVVAETHDTKTFHLVDAEAGRCQFDYHAGQYLTFRFDNFQGKPIARSYTMSSSPLQEDFVSITVKRTVGGKVSNWLYDNLKVGMVLRARGALGKFCYDSDSDQSHLFMIAAGSGVTPFLSIIRQFMHPKVASPPTSMSLLVSYRTMQDRIGWQELKAFSRKDRFNLYLTLTGEKTADFRYGRIAPNMLAEVVGSSMAGKTFMICGPEAMMRTAIDFLLANGADKKQIKTESFLT